MSSAAGSERDVVVVAGVRTAIARYGGAFREVAPVELATAVTREALARSGFAPGQVGHVVFGNVIHTESRDPYLARVAAVGAGCPVETPAMTVNRLCGSGLQAVVSAAQSLLLGDAEVAVAGGAESMSRAPYWLPGLRWGQRMGDGAALDAMTAALSDPFEDCHMGVTAENIAAKWGISREDQDALALASHHRAAAAIAAGRFDGQIVPIEVPGRKGATVVDRDEHVRAELTLAELARLRPAFAPDGTVTAGNASGLNDAAAAVVLATRGAAAAVGAPVLGRLVGYRQVGVEPRFMGIGPVPAVRELLQRHGLSVADIDVFEVNEAFAAQALAVIRDLGLPEDRTNPNGSGVGLGHPIGATGTVLVVKALAELERIEGRYAVVTLCIGGGQGIAALFERSAG